MRKYESPLLNIYNDHVVVRFKDPNQGGLVRMLVLDIREAVAEIEGPDDHKLSAAIALTKLRVRPDETLPEFKIVRASVKPPETVQPAGEMVLDIPPGVATPKAVPAPEQFPLGS